MFTVLWKREFEIQKKKIVRKNVLCDSICFLESKSYISYFWSPALSSKGDRKLLSGQKYASCRYTTRICKYNNNVRRVDLHMSRHQQHLVIFEMQLFTIILELFLGMKLKQLWICLEVITLKVGKLLLSLELNKHMMMYQQIKNINDESTLIVLMSTKQFILG